jgi:hypothetical protein
MPTSGRSVAISPFRRLVCDLMHFSQGTPAVEIERRMDLAEVCAARQRCTPRPNWCGIFSKAFGIVGRTFPELRRCYMQFPWPRFYEHPHSIVSLNIERECRGEPLVLQALIRRPENRTLAQIDAIIRHYQQAPLEGLRWYHRSMALSRVPRPLRRWLWWAALNVFGRRRCHNFGTFSMSSVAALGCGLVHLVPVLAYNLHYGMFDEHGRLDVRLTWDHRVTDGAPAARILVELEKVLNGEILAELNALASEVLVLGAAKAQAA